MQALVEVILPVFLLIGMGYGAVWKGWLPDSAVSGLMRFATNFAVPCLLFRAISTLDLGQDFELSLLGSYYVAALGAFLVAMLGARLIFGRPWEDSVAIGFVGLFSNSLLLGLPITERAYGAQALGPNYAILSIHAPFCYAVGITAMELVRSQGGGLLRMVPRILAAMLRNALVVGIGLGFVVNLSGMDLPRPFTDALDLLARAALPVALFGLGGVLYRYRPEGDMRTILFVCAVSLMLHPALVWVAGRGFGLEGGAFRSAVLTAAMAPGVNAYLFADMYGVARRVAASAVLIGTVLGIVTIWLWLALLG